MATDPTPIESDQDFLEYIRFFYASVTAKIAQLEDGGDPKRLHYYRGMAYALANIANTYDDICNGEYL